MHPFFIVVFILGSLVWTGSPLQSAAVQEESRPPNTEPAREAPVGHIVGHVAVDADLKLLAPPQIVLMSPFWTEVWNGTLQQSLDVYLMRYRQAVARDHGAYIEIAGWAYREAASLVLARMREALQDEFSDWVRATSDEGRFEFSDVPFGDYRMVVLATTGSQTLIWSESLTVSSPIPQYIEVQHRVP